MRQPGLLLLRHLVNCRCPVMAVSPPCQRLAEEEACDSPLANETWWKVFQKILDDVFRCLKNTTHEWTTPPLSRAGSACGHSWCGKWTRPSFFNDVLEPLAWPNCSYLTSANNTNYWSHHRWKHLELIRYLQLKTCKLTSCIWWEKRLLDPHQLAKLSECVVAFDDCIHGFF